MNLQNNKIVLQRDQENARGREISNQSEIAALLEQVKREHGMAAWAATSIGNQVSRQTYTRRRKEAIARCQRQLGKLVGDRSAASLVRQVMMQTTPTQKGQVASPRQLQEQQEGV